MDTGIVWVISDDTEFCISLSDLLERQTGCLAVSQTYSASTGNGRVAGRPSHVFLDLRNDEAWPHLGRIHAEVGKFGGTPTSFIGIIGNGFPLDWTVEANQILSATLRWPLSLAELSQRIGELCNTPLTNSREASTEYRLLEGGGLRFLTYAPSLFSMLDELTVAAKRDFTILLVGETGTGKTTLARLVHEMSPRRKKRFLTVACGALPNDLINSELFGHVKGAFTGAERTKIGKFDAADKGTILLDEIDVLGMIQQANLLRVIETGEFEPVGSNDTHKVDARAIVASNVSLEKLIENGWFRADLYFRLNQVKFEIPPLRKRRRDIVPLAVDIIKSCCQEYDFAVSRVDPEFLTVLEAYSWPGNIRELANEVRRVVLFCRDGVASPSALSPTVVRESSQAIQQEKNSPVKTGLAGEVAQTEQDAIEQMLRTQNLNRAATARALGISRVTLYNKIRKYQISVESLTPSSRK